MKLLVLTAIFAVAFSSPHSKSKTTWPWLVGQEYVYDVDTYTWTTYEDTNSKGNAFKAQFIIRVSQPGHLMAKLEKPMYAQINSKEMGVNVVPSDLQYTPMPITDDPIEILVDGGRVTELIASSSLSTAHENLLKGLISALQVDLSSRGLNHRFANIYDEKTFQGTMSKTETDVTGSCETLYTVSPMSVEWRREIPEFADIEDPIEIIKAKNYDDCKKHVELSVGVPEGENHKKQLIKRTTDHRLIVGKQGTIYKSEVISSASASPLFYGKQKAEVFGYVKMYLYSVHKISDVEWTKAESIRHIKSLVFELSESMFYPKDADKKVVVVQKLLQEMSPMLQNPSKLPKADFLSKFTTLVRFVQTLTQEQLTYLTNNIEVARTSKNESKYAMWIIYRDAVAQGGTPAAFEEIKSWVLSKKVQGEEAAELLSAIGASFRFPNLKDMTEFFNFAMDPEVMNQKYVNTSAILAATKLLRFTNEYRFIRDTVLPSLSEKLKVAVDNGDSNKAQVYIRALGNLAAPTILKVYAPYLDGRIVISKYLRTQMVASLKFLANLKDDNVRAALFNILRNTAESYEVRVAAALNIFLAFPTAEMMQVMAHMTNYDPSTQVRAVLANGINFAAELKDPRFAELAKTAKAVKEFVAKEKFGYGYSTNSMIDEFTDEEDYAFFRELSYIDSQDNALPKYHRSALRSIGTGWTEENQVTFSVSSVQRFLEYLLKTVYEPQKSKFDFKYSSKKIAEMLNIKPISQEPLEGSFFIENFNQQKLITFNEDDLNDLLRSTVNNMENLLKGIDIQYTKILNNKLTYVVFPLASGMPFFFDYHEPLICSVQGQIKFKVDTKDKEPSGSLYNDLEMIYARNMEGTVGYYDTLGDVYASVGVINKVQFYIPTKVNVVATPGDIKLDFQLPENDANLVHLSVWPYSAFQKIWDGLTVSENPTTQYVERSDWTFNTNFDVGEWAGLGYQWKLLSHSKDYEDLDKLKDDAGLLTTLGYFFYQKDIAMTKFNFNYIAAECRNKKVTFSLFYDTLYNQKHGGEMAPAVPVTDTNARREVVTKRAAAGIESAEVQLYDLSVIFDGEKKIEFLLTAAVADSFIDNKVQGAFFYKGFEQFNAVFKLSKPKMIPLNFEEALKYDMTVTYEADFKYGKFDNVHLTGTGERSALYTELLKKDPLAKKCLQQTSNHNVYQMDCYKMIIKAHAPDTFEATLTFKENKEDYITLTKNFYDFVKDWYSHEKEEDFSVSGEKNKVEIKVEAYYYYNYVNYKFTSENGYLALNGVKGLEYYPYMMSLYGPIGHWERTMNIYRGFQYLPYCAVDNSKVWTFSGRSYNYSLTSSWHVVMAHEARDNDLVILTRRPADNEEEVYVSYKNGAGKYLELHIKDVTVDVETNAKQVSKGALTSYWDDDNEVPLLEYYSLAPGVLVFNINDQALRIVFDKQRLIIFTDKYRSSTIGICGQSTSQFRDDYMTPWGLVDRPELYGAAFSLEGEYSDAKTAALKEESKWKAYQPVIKYTKIAYAGPIRRFGEGVISRI